MGEARKRPALGLVRAVIAASALVLTARIAAAQGAFYVEQEKDGRIYVFNDMKKYDAWRRSGEVGTGITRPGAGSRGETIVFDGEEAIHLYNFKHGNPGEVLIKPVEKTPVQKFGWKDGKTSFESDSAKLVISNRVQFRFTAEDPDGKDSKGSFRVRRAKTKFEGWFQNPKLQYELQLNWPDTANPLEDVNLNVDLSGTQQAMIKVGQFKVPFGRQELTSSGSQQFVDRSIVAAEFEKGRDIGVQFWGLANAGRLDWRVGVFNGAGRTKSANDNTKFQYDARLTYQPWGDVKYSESDFESKDQPLLALAANAEWNDQQGSSDGVDVDRFTWGGDVSFKFKGLSVMGEYLWRDNQPEPGEDGAVAPDFKTDGYHLQVGYFLIRDRLEIAGRRATFDPTDLEGGNDRSENGVAVGWFFNKHALKVQGDYRRVTDKAKDTDDNELRMQLQFIF